MSTDIIIPPEPGFSAENLMRLAIERGGEQSVAIIERLMPIRRELEAERAKKAFDAAMAAFQAECPVILKQKDVRDGASSLYKYSPLEDIVTQIKPFTLKHGFSYEFDTDVTSEAGWVIAKCNVTHREGHVRTSIAKFPLGKGTRLMSDTQIYASALTFATRRVLCNAFGIVPAGEDMDGRIKKGAVRVDPAVRALMAELWKILKPVRGDKMDWQTANEWLWREGILDGANPDDVVQSLPSERLQAVIEQVKAKLK